MTNTRCDCCGTLIGDGGVAPGARRPPSCIVDMPVGNSTLIVKVCAHPDYCYTHREAVSGREVFGDVCASCGAVYRERIEAAAALLRAPHATVREETP